MRERWVDVARGIGIILVLLGHAGIPINNKYIYGFHMALFWIIVGYCYNKENKYTNWKYINNRLNNVIKPYFYYAMVNLVIVGCIIIGKYGINNQVAKELKNHIYAILIGGGTDNIDCLIVRHYGFCLPPLLQV